MPSPRIFRGPRPASPTAPRFKGILAAAPALVVVLAACAGVSERGSGETPSPGVVEDGAVVEASPSRSVQPGAPGTAGRALTDEELRAGERHAHTEADVRFMENMIHHHAQAVEMSRLVPDRTENPDILLLARRIDRSQDDEIAFMARWLRDRGEPVPAIAEALMGGGMDAAGAHDDHAHHHDHGAHGHDDDPLMAGMLTAEQLQELADARDDAFDRLFLEFMVYHHEGAIDMVEALFATRGAAQDTELFQFASHVDADQRIEIGRMTRMLRAGR